MLQVSLVPQLTVAFLAARVHRHEPPVGTNLPRILDLGRARGGDGSPIELDGFIVEGLGIPDQLVMVDKPSSIPVHPSGRYHHNSVTRLLHSLHPELFPHKKGALTKVFPCNRLDRLTSGLLTMALNAERAKEFEGHFGGRRVGKIYVARVRGEFPEGIITCDAPLMVYEHKLSLNCVSPSGKPAVTVFERLSFNGFSSVVRCKPLTGRTHQIRVHLLYLGHPIANDPLYGNDFWDEERPQMVLEPFPDNPDLRNEEPLARRVAERMRQATGGNRLGGWNFEGTEEAGSAMPGASQTAISDEAESKEGSTIPRQESEEGFESFCQDCRDKRPDPAPDQLGIWLHAMQYEFPSTPRPDIPEGATWTIRSPLPVWAASHFADDQRIIELLQSLWRGGFLLAPD